jgi:hypothetical protein
MMSTKAFVENRRLPQRTAPCGAASSGPAASSGRTVELGAADWWSYFDHRRVVPPAPNKSAGTTAFTWPTDGTRHTSRAFATGDGAAEGMPIAVTEDRNRYTHRWPLTEPNRATAASPTPTHADADQLAARLPLSCPH